MGATPAPFTPPARRCAPSSIVVPRHAFSAPSGHLIRRRMMKVLAFAGSLRPDSRNQKLAREAVRLLLVHGEAAAEFVDLRDYAMPLYDGDIERAGIPDSITALGTRIAEADALVIATPEYNGSISSVLKNTIDWLSRV